MKRSLGLDLGADTLRAALCTPGKPPSLWPLGDADHPTLGAEVGVCTDAQDHEALLVGSAVAPLALFGAERRVALLPRWLGQPWADAQTDDTLARQPCGMREGPRGDVYIELGKTTHHPEVLLAALLRQIRERAAIEPQVDAQTLTVAIGVASGDAQRRAIAHAAQLAGFSSLALVHGAEVAALEHATRASLPVGHCLALVDWGASSFDGALVEQTAEGLRLLSVVGDAKLGGADLDALAVGKHRAEMDPDRVGPWLDHPLSKARLISAWRRAKERLVDAAQTSIVLPSFVLDRPQAAAPEHELTRRAWLKSIEPFVARAEALCVALISEGAQNRSGDAPTPAPLQVVVCGGAAALPKIRNRLTVALGQHPDLDTTLAAAQEPVVEHQAEPKDAEAQPAVAADIAEPSVDPDKGAQSETSVTQAQGSELDIEHPAENLSESNAPGQDIAAAEDSGEPPSEGLLAPSRMMAGPPPPRGHEVALGAARWAALTQKAESITSRLGTHMGLATEDGEFVQLVPRNTELPAASCHHLVAAPAEDGGRPQIRMALFSAPELLLERGTWLGDVTLEPSRKHKAEQPCAVTLDIDVDGLVEIRGVDSHDNPCRVTWDARPGLSDDELDGLMAAAQAAAQQRAHQQERISLLERSSELTSSAQQVLAQISEESDAELVASMQAANQDLMAILAYKDTELPEDSQEQQAEIQEDPQFNERLRASILALEIAQGRLAHATRQTSSSQPAAS